MSLNGSLQIAGTTLQAMQVGLQVVGNNIANANTPGYVREQVVYVPAPLSRSQGMAVGMGVQTAGIVQSIDRFVEERLRDAGGDRAAAEAVEDAYADLETILSELSDTDVSTLMTSFFNSVDEVLNEPESLAIRGLAVQSGLTLANSLNTLNRRVEAVYQDFAGKVDLLGSEINTLSDEIRKLNLAIVQLEGGGGNSEAGGLRSTRQSALNRLAEIADVRTFETSTGSVNVSVGGAYLVYEGTRNEVAVLKSADDGLLKATVTFADGSSPLRVSKGELQGVYEARDRVVGGFLSRLDEFAGALAFEFNKVHSRGQGMSGFAEVQSTERVSDVFAPLDEAGLAFTPVSGSFELLLYNRETKLTKTTTVVVDLNGLDGDASLSSLAAQLDAVDGVVAEVTGNNRLRIAAESSETELGFGGDNSGLLAALGINTFFTGSRARDLAVNAVLQADVAKFAAATDGIGVGSANAEQLVALFDRGVDSLNGGPIGGFYDQLVGETARGATAAKAVAEGLRTFEGSLEAKALAVSGVNIDEEAIDLIMLQRTYQAAAKYVATLSELLELLISL